MVHKIVCLETSKSFRGDGTKSIAVDDISTTFNKGEFTAIMGSSGSGKSTLLSLIGTLDKPTKEKITYGSEESIKKGNKHISDFLFNKIGFIFQQVHLPPTLTSLENLLTPLITQKVSYKKVESANEVLSQVGLPIKLESDVIFVTYDSLLVVKANHNFIKINETVVSSKVGVTL